jgi:hypothetical protein
MDPAWIARKTAEFQQRFKNRFSNKVGDEVTSPTSSSTHTTNRSATMSSDTVSGAKDAQEPVRVQQSAPNESIESVDQQASPLPRRNAQQHLPVLTHLPNSKPSAANCSDYSTPKPVPRTRSSRLRVQAPSRCLFRPHRKPSFIKTPRHPWSNPYSGIPRPSFPSPFLRKRVRVRVLHNRKSKIKNQKSQMPPITPAVAAKSITNGNQTIVGPNSAVPMPITPKSPDAPAATRSNAPITPGPVNSFP